MSDTWYRDPPTIPPYEAWDGTLWTWDGLCLNPVHTCEPPSWYHELLALELQAEIAFSQREYPQYHDRFEPVHPCRVMPTRHCPASYGMVCGDRPCARFESDDETPWLPEVGP